MILNSRHIIIPSGWMDIRTPRTAADDLQDAPYKVQKIS